MLLRVAVALGSMLALSSCRDHEGNGEAGKQGDGEEDAPVVDARHSETPEFYAADAAYLQKNSTFFFKVWGDAFTKDLDDLPMKGEVPDEKKPHSGGYYAEGDGGTNQIVAGNKTPLQKYDAAFNGGQNKAAAWEQEKHTTGPVWAGHCNGFAATTQRHPKEPFKPVTKNGVTFEPQDVKALLAEIHMNADYEFLGGNRCDIEGTPPAPTDRTDPTVMAACEDINPGTLHAAIANWIGRTKHTLIMDMFAGDQVWNYPLYKYEVTRKDGITEAQAKQYVTGAAGADYQFNPSATKFAYVETTLTFAEAFKREALKTLTPGTMALKYVLEMDAAGAILGGEWVGADSRKNHPDFLWVALEPLEPNGTRYMGNQYLSNQEVIKLWAESVGEDPENPPLDIKRPSGPDDWGKWPDFEITLDGNQRGAVFGGKPATLRIKRKEQLLGDVALEVLLNGASLKKVNATGEEEIKFAFNPGIGLSRLQFNWTRGSTALDPEYARFHAVR